MITFHDLPLVGYVCQKSVWDSPIINLLCLLAGWSPHHCHVFQALFLCSQSQVSTYPVKAGHAFWLHGSIHIKEQTAIIRRPKLWKVILIPCIIAEPDHCSHPSVLTHREQLQVPRECMAMRPLANYNSMWIFRFQAGSLGYRNVSERI